MAWYGNQLAASDFLAIGCSFFTGAALTQFAATAELPFPGFTQQEMNAEQAFPPQSALVLQLGTELQLHAQNPRNFVASSVGAFAACATSGCVDTVSCATVTADWGTPTPCRPDEPSKVGAESVIASANTTAATTYSTPLFTIPPLKAESGIPGSPGYKILRRSYSSDSECGSIANQYASQHQQKDHLHDAEH